MSLDGSEFSARAIIRALKGSWHGGTGMARCPAHEDTTPSFAATQRGDVILVHCHAGCSQSQVLGALQDRGLWPHREERAHPSYPTRTVTVREDDPDVARRSEIARKLWEQSQPIKNTLAEKYLAARGIRLPHLPDSLRFIPNLPHPTGVNGGFPVMLAAITDSHGAICGVQRTYLNYEGSGKADVSPPKVSLGPMRDGAVRLGKPRDALGLAEGIETALAARKIYSLPVWATLGAQRLKSIGIPDGVKRILIFADQGDTGAQAAADAKYLFDEQGFRTHVIFPDHGSDFADQIKHVNHANQGERLNAGAVSGL